MSDCISERNDARCVFSQHGKTVTFCNDGGNSFDRGIVDGCIIADDRERCDYFLRIPDRIWLVELKGANVEKAVSQICSTISHIEPEIGGREIIPVIITSQTPAVAGHHKLLKPFKKFGSRISGRIVLKTRTAKIDLV